MVKLPSPSMRPEGQHSQRMGESRPRGTEKQPDTRFNITGRNISGHKGSTRHNAILAGTVTYYAKGLHPLGTNALLGGTAQPGGILLPQVL